MPDPHDEELVDAEALDRLVQAFRAKHPETSFVFGLRPLNGERIFRFGGSPEIQTALAGFLQGQAVTRDVIQVQSQSGQVVQLAPGQGAALGEALARARG